MALVHGSDRRVRVLIISMMKFQIHRESAWHLTNRQQLGPVTRLSSSLETACCCHCCSGLFDSMSWCDLPHLFLRFSPNRRDTSAGQRSTAATSRLVSTSWTSLKSITKRPSDESFLSLLSLLYYLVFVILLWYYNSIDYIRYRWNYSIPQCYEYVRSKSIYV